MTRLMEKDYSKFDKVDFIDLAKVSFIERTLRRLTHNILPNFWSKWIFRGRNLDKNTTVVLFDSIITNNLCKYICACFQEADIRFWLWNNISKQVILRIKESGCKVYSFDKKQCIENQLKYHPQFLPYNQERLQAMEISVGKDVVFVGADKGRLELLCAIANFLDRNKISYSFTVKPDNSTVMNSEVVTYNNKGLAYSKLLSKYAESLCVLDINKDGQNGLTLRPIECLFLNKKLITNNQSIKSYDFYHPNNIYVIDGLLDEEGFINFLRAPFVINDDVKLNYEFTHWLTMITD